MKFITFYYWAYDNYYYKVDYWYDMLNKQFYEISTGTALPELVEIK